MSPNQTRYGSSHTVLTHRGFPRAGRAQEKPQEHVATSGSLTSSACDAQLLPSGTHKGYSSLPRSSQSSAAQGCEPSFCRWGSTRPGAAEPAETWEGWLPQRIGSIHPCPEKQPLKVRSGVHSTHGLQLEEYSPGSSCLTTAPYHTHPESPSTGSRALCDTCVCPQSNQILTLDVPVRTTVL